MESCKQRFVISSSEESSSSSNCGSNASENKLFDFRNKNTRQNARLPTRRPDPNVFNRNALLARENRRRKKAHLEDMEKDLQEMRDRNYNLLKLLKKERRTVKKLEQEKCYYRGILKNQSEIRDLLSALNSRLPLISQQKEGLVLRPPDLLELNKTPYVSISSSCSNNIVRESLELTPTSQNDELFNHIKGEDIFISSVCSSTSSELSYESLSQFEPFSSPEWGELQRDLHAYMETGSVLSDHIDSNICNGHINACSSVSGLCETNEDTEDVGICLHVKQRKVTLEYCPHCDRNACLDKKSDLIDMN